MSAQVNQQGAARKTASQAKVHNDRNQQSLIYVGRVQVHLL